MSIFSKINDTTTTGKLPGYAAGMWNPETAEEKKKEAGSFGLHPYITNVSKYEGATLGLNVDLWSLMVKKDALKDNMKFDMTIQDKIGNDSNGNMTLCKDALVSLDFDSNMRTIWKPEGKLNDWFGEFQGRVILNGQYGYNAESNVHRFSTSMSSLTLGLADPFHLGRFSLVKGLFYTWAYTGSSAIGGNSDDVLQGNLNAFGEAASGSLYGKFEMLLAADSGSSVFKFANFYLKHRIANDMLKATVYSGEDVRAGLLLGLGRGTISSEFYNSPAYYEGDPYRNNIDMDLSVNYKLWDWASKDGKRTIDITGCAYTTEVMGWINRGYDMPPIGLKGMFNLHFPGIDVFFTAEGTVKGKKVSKGVLDKVETKSYTSSEQWEGIAIRTDGSAYQASKTVTITGAPKSFTVIDPNNKPKMVINAPADVRYMTRSLIVGETGESALPANWNLGTVSPVKIYIKSVKIKDKINNKVYALDTTGQWKEIPTDLSEPAPDLTGANIAFAGGSQSFTLPEAVWQSERGDGRMDVDAIVEYGADVSKVDKSAVQRYSTGSSPIKVYDPNWGIMNIYNNSVKWPGYNYSDPNREEVDPYDPTLPHDPDTNPYYAGLKKLEPIPLNVQVTY